MKLNLSMTFLKLTISVSLCLGLFISCSSKNCVEKYVEIINEAFLLSGERDSSIKQISADSLFNVLPSVFSSESYTVVYLFDACCSTCISGSFEFMKAYKNSILSTTPILYISKCNEIQLFEYYFAKNKMGKIVNPVELITIENREDVPNGMYFVLNGKVIQYCIL